MSKYKYFKKAQFVYNGDWNDPELIYNSKKYNYFLIENTIYERFKDFIEENKIEDNEENLIKYCEEHIEDIEEIFQITE
jgi:hypothetical protein